MPKDQGQTPPDYMGLSENRRQLRYWDPASQSFVIKDVDPADWKQYSPGGEYGWYTNSQGERVYGLIPQQRHLTYDDGYEMVEGPDPNWQPIVVPDRLGMAEDGFQRTPSNTVNDPYLPWQGSRSHDPEGNVIPGGPADPFASPSSPLYRPPNFEGVTNEQLGAGGGAVTGPSYADDLRAIAEDINARTPPIGYESSTNQPFYQQQFKQMREADLRNRMRADAAALRRGAPQPEPEPTDPWAWANLPEVVQGGALPEGVNRGDWILNPAYDWGPQTTNAQMIADMGGILNSDEQAMINQHLQTSPNWESSLAWANQPRADVYARTFGGNNVQDPNWTNVLQKVLGNVWVQAGDAPTPGGLPVPTGYASPINA